MNGLSQVWCNDVCKEVTADGFIYMGSSGETAAAEDKTVMSSGEKIQLTRNMNYLHEVILFLCLTVSVLFIILPF